MKKNTFFFMLLFFLTGCQIAGTLYNVGSKVGAIVMDERSIKDDWTDSKINLTLRGKLASANPAYALDIEITVFESEVMLNGALPNIEDIERVTEIAWQIEPVTKVYNHIRLKKPSTLIDTSKDAYIASSIRTDLMMTQGITSVNYKITVEDSTLYVMGIAADNLEYKRVMNILKSQKGINKIISHVRKSYKTNSESSF